MLIHEEVNSTVYKEVTEVTEVRKVRNVQKVQRSTKSTKKYKEARENIICKKIIMRKFCCNIYIIIL